MIIAQDVLLVDLKRSIVWSHNALQTYNKRSLKSLENTQQRLNEKDQELMVFKLLREDYEERLKNENVIPT